MLPYYEEQTVLRNSKEAPGRYSLNDQLQGSEMQLRNPKVVKCKTSPSYEWKQSIACYRDSMIKLGYTSHEVTYMAETKQYN